MKLVINSNKKYLKPINVLFKSLLDIKFGKISEVLLILSGCEEDNGPYLKKICEVSDVDSDEKICVINLKQNNYDYSGYQALFLFKDHELVKSESYFYVLDTVTFEKEFNDCYQKMLKVLANTDFITTCPHPHSNICAFGNKIIDSYQNNFETIVSKDEAIRLEHGLPVVKENKEIKSIVSFGKFVPIEERVFCGEEDIYSTGYPRQKFLYKSFGLNKWILFHFHGDITSNLTKNNPDLGG